MIGLSLAALVAGSLITLAVLAQRVTLDSPVGVQEIQPRRSSTSEPAPPLVVANEAPPSAPERDRPRRDRAGEVIEDQVLPLRISRAATPAREGAKRGGKDKGDDRGDDAPRRYAAALPPGIIKKVNGGGQLPPGHRKRVSAAARPDPKVAHGNGRGACGPPPCGNGGGPHTTSVATSKIKSSGNGRSKGKGHGGN